MRKVLVQSHWHFPLVFEDVVQSYLVEEPDSYYMFSTKQWLYYLDRDLGLLQLVNDFSQMDDEEVSEYINEILTILRKH